MCFTLGTIKISNNFSIFQVNFQINLRENWETILFPYFLFYNMTKYSNNRSQHLFFNVQYGIM
jgi:hypothetical protein